MSRNQGIHFTQGRTKSRRVWFAEDVAPQVGRGVCFDFAYAASSPAGRLAADPFGGRESRVKYPTTANNMAFAGVIAESKPAVIGGQFVEIWEPGGLALIRTDQNTTINETFLTASVVNDMEGYFSNQGFMGRGTALALQTTAGILARVIDGSAALDSNGTTITKSGETYSADGVAVGDKLFVIGGENDGSNSVTPQQVTVTAVGTTTITVGTAVSTGGDMQVSFFTETNNAPNLVLAYLFDGEESGLTEVINPTSNAASTAPMAGGYTFIHGGTTLAGNATATLADLSPSRNGVRKGLKTLGTLGTSDYVLTITSGLEYDMTGLASIALDAAGEFAILEWFESEWIMKGGTATFTGA